MTQQRRTAGTPLGAVGRGLAVGAVGTLAMDVLLCARYRRGRGKRAFPTWEFSAGATLPNRGGPVDRRPSASSRRRHRRRGRL